MSWTMTANKSGGGGVAFEKPPPGNHPARLVAIVDMGTLWQEGYQGAEGKYQHRAFFVWELVNAKQSGSTRNHTIGIDLTFSLNEKAKLRAWIGAQRGKPVADGEPFSLDTWLGHACLLNVVEKNGYPKIDGVTGVPTGFVVPEPQNTPFAWKVDAAAKTGKIDLPTWLPYFYGKPIGDTIQQCQELEGKAVEVVNSHVQAPPAATSAPANTDGGSAGGPPPRRRRDVATATQAAPVAEWFVDADGFAADKKYSVAEIQKHCETAGGVDLANLFVTGPGYEGWTPVTVAIPASRGWIPF
jgi:hypothetical protein